MTITEVESQLTFLYDALIDLASSADRQAARAAEFNDTTASSALFTLADQLRTMAHTVKENPTPPSAFDLLDAGRWQIATAMLRFDASEERAVPPSLGDREPDEGFATSIEYEESQP